MNSSLLHLLAMVCMLIDHIGATQVGASIILRCIGRLAFPIYTFMIVEGFKHTKNLKKYMARMALFALASEIPFNLMVSGYLFDFYHQNVLWTFLIALVCLYVIDYFKKEKSILSILLILATVYLGYYLGNLFHTDYQGAGVLMVLVFYLFEDKKCWQLIAMYILNVYFIGSYQLPMQFNHQTIYFPIQALAILSLLFIWTYNGKRGIKSKLFQYFCYAFYPLHMLILAII